MSRPVTPPSPRLASGTPTTTTPQKSPTLRATSTFNVTSFSEHPFTSSLDPDQFLAAAGASNLSSQQQQQQQQQQGQGGNQQQGQQSRASHILYRSIAVSEGLDPEHYVSPSVQARKERLKEEESEIKQLLEKDHGFARTASSQVWKDIRLLESADASSLLSPSSAAAGGGGGDLTEEDSLSLGGTIGRRKNKSPQQHQKKNNTNQQQGRQPQNSSSNEHFTKFAQMNYLAPWNLNLETRRMIEESAVRQEEGTAVGSVIIPLLGQGGDAIPKPGQQFVKRQLLSATSTTSGPTTTTPRENNNNNNNNNNSISNEISSSSSSKGKEELPKYVEMTLPAEEAACVSSALSILRLRRQKQAETERIAKVLADRENAARRIQMWSGRTTDFSATSSSNSNKRNKNEDASSSSSGEEKDEKEEDADGEKEEKEEQEEGKKKKKKKQEKKNQQKKDEKDQEEEEVDEEDALTPTQLRLRAALLIKQEESDTEDQRRLLKERLARERELDKLPKPGSYEAIVAAFERSEERRREFEKGTPARFRKWYDEIKVQGSWIPDRNLKTVEQLAQEELEKLESDRKQYDSERRRTRNRVLVEAFGAIPRVSSRIRKTVSRDRPDFVSLRPMLCGPDVTISSLLPGSANEKLHQRRREEEEEMSATKRSSSLSSSATEEDFLCFHNEYPRVRPSTVLEFATWSQRKTETSREALWRECIQYHSAILEAEEYNAPIDQQAEVDAKADEEALDKEDFKPPPLVSHEEEEQMRLKKEYEEKARLFGESRVGSSSSPTSASSGSGSPHHQQQQHQQKIEASGKLRKQMRWLHTTIAVARSEIDQAEQVELFMEMQRREKQRRKEEKLENERKALDFLNQFSSSAETVAGSNANFSGSYVENSNNNNNNSNDLLEQQQKQQEEGDEHNHVTPSSSSSSSASPFLLDTFASQLAQQHEEDEEQDEHQNQHHHEEEEDENNKSDENNNNVKKNQQQQQQHTEKTHKTVSFFSEADSKKPKLLQESDNNNNNNQEQHHQVETEMIHSLLTTYNDDSNAHSINSSSPANQKTSQTSFFASSTSSPPIDHQHLLLQMHPSQNSMSEADIIRQRRITEERNERLKQKIAEQSQIVEMLLQSCLEEEIQLAHSASSSASASNNYLQNNSNNTSRNLAWG